MRIPFYKSDKIVAINFIQEGSNVHVGILIVEPFATEIQKVGDIEFHLTDELINQKQMKIALENQFEVKTPN